MRTFALICLLAFGLAPTATFAAPALAKTAVPDCNKIVSPLPKAAQTFTVGTLRVQRYGDHGRPVILIPGLGSGSWVWAGTVKHLKANHVVYALTLAGFDGVPAPKKKTGLIDQADASLLKLIQSHHIDHPVLVGHSLGGTLAIRFAGEHSKLLSGAVAVDGLPVFPGEDKFSAKQRQARAKAGKAMMAGVTPAQFKAQQLRFMQYMGVIDPAKATCYAKLQDKSDQAAVAQYLFEDLAADYRPGLKNVAVPLLEIHPYNAPDFQKAAARSGKPVMSEKAVTAYYAKLLANDPTAKVVTISPSRHFVMLDQPQKFYAALDHFLATLPPPKIALWKVTSPQRTLYVTGAMGMSTQQRPVPALAAQSFAKSGELVLEGKAGHSVAKQRHDHVLLMRYGHLPNGRTLADELSAKQLKAVKQVLGELGVPFGSVKYLQPWAALMHFGHQVVKKTGVTPHQRYLHFVHAAKSRNMPVVHLDTAKQEMQMLAAMPQKVQVAMLMMTINQIRHPRDEMQNKARTAQAWSDGDMTAAARSFDAVFKPYPKLYKAIVTSRHPRWTKELGALLAKPGKLVFVIVGAPHLFGPGNLLDHLRDAGYQVAQL